MAFIMKVKKKYNRSFHTFHAS